MQKPQSEQNGYVYEFGLFRLEVMERRLFRDGEPVPITPKVFDTLLLLVRNSGHLVEKQELMSRLWPDSFVEEGALTRNISDLRKALGEKATGQKLIETVPKRGYRFVAEVRQLALPQTATDAHQQVMKTQAVQPAIAEPAVPEPAAIPNIDNSSVPAHQPLDVSLPELRPRPFPTQRRKAAIGGMVLSLLGLLGWWNWQDEGKTRPPGLKTVPPEMQLSRLTTSSDVFETALTPDSHWVAYVRGEVGKQSLWGKHLDTQQEIPLVPAAAVRYRGLTFSRDGTHLYYAQRLLSESEFVLYQIPLQGGTPKKLLAGIHSAVTFSPDGQQIAFVREQAATGTSALMVANADGTGLRELKVHHSPEFYSVDGASWSPDGEQIAVALGSSAGGFHYQILLTKLVDGSEQALGNQVWDWAMRVAWLNDGSGILLVGRDKSSFTNQVWQLAYPSGKAGRVINDLNDYRGLSLAADAQSFVTVQSEARTSIWVVPADQPERATQITSNPASQTGYNGLDWTPDGRIVYTARSAGQQDLWLMNADGSAPARLTQDPATRAESPAVSGDGRYLVFTSVRSGVPRIWQMNLDGSQLQELTKGPLDLQPDSSPDGRWVVYSSSNAGKRVIWKVPQAGSAGAEPIPLTDSLTDFPVISPDGKLLLCDYQEQPRAPHRIALFPFTGGAPIQLLNIPVLPKPTVRWHPQGQAVSFLQPEDNSANIWLQSLSGGAAKPVTRFQGEHIFAHAWSADGRYLACSRGSINRDIVLVKHFR